MAGVSLAVIRHAPTAWNETGLVQGHSDPPLSADGRAAAARWRAPPQLADARWLSSPLARARETAELLTGAQPPTDDRLTEMSWGTWEGRTLDDLRAELGDLMVAWEARGLDFKAPDGESPRQVQLRVAPLLAEIAADGAATVAVTHKGVLRAIYALATGWDMTDKPAHKLRDACVHLFRLERDGAPRLDRLNLPLGPEG